MFKKFQYFLERVFYWDYQIISGSKNIGFCKKKKPSEKNQKARNKHQTKYEKNYPDISFCSFTRFRRFRPNPFKNF